MNTIIAYDLGTGGCKASIYSEEGSCLGKVFEGYPTLYPYPGWHEQRPEDWWEAVVKSTRKLLEPGNFQKEDVRCIALSGQSLAVIPLNAEGELLRETIPIWSDTRTQDQTQYFFSIIDETEWYKTTGNGFSRECYSLFKIMWYRDNEPDLYKKTAIILGSKDYINYKLTGKIATDHSYGSGTGAYNLEAGTYEKYFLEAAEIPGYFFPELRMSTDSLGKITKQAAEILGLSPETEVICGGVDNSCMALGAGNIEEGKAYLSLGSSAWIAVSSENPVISTEIKPYVFAHVLPGMYTSATSIFSAGTSVSWLKDTLCADIKKKAEESGKDPYDLLIAKASQSPIGANRLFFNPSLSGGSAAYLEPGIRGAFLGLDLKHDQSDIIRAVLEGIAMDLRIMFSKLEKLCSVPGDILIVGGGSKSKFWRQIFADIFNRSFCKTNIDQDAASLGAAALGAVGAGIWQDFSPIANIHQIEDKNIPDPVSSQKYRNILDVYQATWNPLGQISKLMGNL